MTNLRDIFQTVNLEKIPDHYWNGKRPICYYPSSGDDFRHIFYWDHYCEKQNIEFPEIFIHTDFTCLDWNPYPKEYLGRSLTYYEKLEKEGIPLPHPFLYNGYILDVFGEGNSVVIKSWTEMFLKNDVFYPNSDIYSFPDRIGEKTHKVYAIQCQLINLERDVYSLANGDTLKSLSGQQYKIIDPKDRHNWFSMRVADEEGKEWNYHYNSFIYPTAKQFIIFLFTMENSNFFYDVLLENNIKIDFLTHINDGGASLGGSKTKMNFIYLYSETIGLKNMLIDCTLEEKQKCFSKWENYNYYNPKIRRKSFERESFERESFERESFERESFKGESFREEFFRGEFLKREYLNRAPLIRKPAELNIEDWNVSKVFFPGSTGIYIQGKLLSGHYLWDYSDFDEVPSNINESNKILGRIEKNSYYVYEYYHYKKK